MEPFRPAKYVNPYTDFGFKMLFGSDVNKELLISFVNSLLHEEEEIEAITYLNLDHIGIQATDPRDVLCLLCLTKNNDRVLIELQRGVYPFFKDHCVRYSNFPIYKHSEGVEQKVQLKAVYVIGILNFVFDDSHDNYFHHEVKLLDTRTKEVFYDKLTFVYLEMPKFNKTEDELETMFDKWLFVLSNLSRLLERPAALQECVFNRLFEAAEIAKFTKEQYEAYEDSLKVYRDWKNTITTAHNKGIAEGEAIGKMKMIQQMLKSGLPKEQICQISGLTLEELNAMIKE